MPAPTDIATLKSFLGYKQFYHKFLPNLSTITASLQTLLKKGEQWHWKTEQQDAFLKLKEMLCTDTLLAHFDPSLNIGISCDASDMGIGAVLFHRYKDGSERPISHASKTVTQKRYSQIQKKALFITYALRNIQQFLYGRKFILVTDHKPPLARLGPTKATPAMAANQQV